MSLLLLFKSTFFGILGGVSATGGVGTLAPQYSNSGTVSGVSGSGQAGAENEQVSASIFGYNRPSTATYFDVNGVLQTASVGVLRPLYDPVLHTYQGPLLEAASTNYALQSSAMGGSWGGADLSVTHNAATAPDGTTTAVLLTELLDPVTATQHYWNTVATGIPVNAPITWSLFVHDNNGRYGIVGMYDNTTTSNSAFVGFDLTLGILATPLHFGASTVTTGTITNVGNGWYRISITATLSATATTDIIARVFLTNTLTSTVPNIFGDGVSSFYVWGAQVEPGSIVTSYIPTTTLAVTRAADGPLEIAQGQVGVVIASVGGNLTGVSAAAQAGDMPYLMEDFSGVFLLEDGTGALTFDFGVQATSVSPGTVGVIGTGQVGTIAVQFGASTTFAGASGSGQTGNIATEVDDTATLIGVVGSGQVGSIITEVDDSINLIGVAGSGQIGISTTEVDTNMLAGASASGQTGIIATEVDDTAALIGVSGSGSSGTAISQIAALILGVSGSGQIGSFSDLTSIAITGVSAAGIAVTLGGGTFTRASTATYLDAAGIIRTAANDVLRPWYNPNTLALLGVLDEPTATNLLLQSADLSNAIWISGSRLVTAPIVTANQTTAPDGTLTAAKVVYPAVPATTNFASVSQTLNATAAPYSFSIYLKGNVGGEFLYLYLKQFSGGTYYSQAVTLTTAWQRFIFVTPALDITQWTIAVGTDRRGSSGQLATLAQTIFAWGGQFELSSATSYIPTAGTAVTRAADTVSTDGIPVILSSVSAASGTAQVNSLADQNVAALTGVASTGQSGIATAQMPISIFGASGIGQVGTEIAQIAVGAIGNASAIGQVGTEIAQITTPIIGSSGVGNAGTVATSISESESLIGVAAIGQAAIEITNVSIPIIGSSGVGNAGTVATSISESESLIGVAAIGQVGTEIVQISTLIIGQMGVGDAGTLVTTSINIGLIDGVFGSGLINTLIADIVIFDAIALYDNVLNLNELVTNALNGRSISASFSTDDRPRILTEIDFLLYRAPS